jgi:exodeoxyribonuclease-3
MRIATWNVNSLKARLEKVEWWLARAAPDVLLMQETKLGDDDAPVLPFRMLGYDLLHHGEGRWNGVAIASRVGIEDIVANFGDGTLRGNSGAAAAAGRSGGTGFGPVAGTPGESASAGAPGDDDFNPFDEARMVSAVCGGIRVVSVYAPNGRVVDSPWYAGKLRWFERVERWLAETQSPATALVIGGDLNVAPTDEDVWNAAAAHGGTHVSEPERAAFRALLDWGLVDTWRAANPGLRRFTWWDYRAGNFQRNEGMRIDHLLASPPAAARIVAVEVDREARKGTPTPSDHAPLVLDLDEPGKPFDAGWAGTEDRFAARRAAKKG